jgi:N-acylneuraminate cytidylyltransferase
VFDRVVVSTDSESIAAVAIEQGAEVPFLRASALADDVTPVSAATVDVLERLDPGGERYRAVCQLMANCPLIEAGDVVASFRHFRDSAADAQISIARYGWQSPWWAMQRDTAGVVHPLFPDRLSSRSQDLPELYCPTGAIWWAKADILRAAGTFHVAGRTGWEIPWLHALDIDTEEDLLLAAAIFEARLRIRDIGRPG